MVYCQHEIARNKANLAISVLLCKRKYNLDCLFDFNFRTEMNLLKCSKQQKDKKPIKRKILKRDTPPGGKSKVKPPLAH
jgi:hypothetical protein